MKVRSMNVLALIVALVPVILMVTVGILYDIHIRGIVVFGSAGFIVSYILCRVAVNKFIVYKIKPVYQLALSRNIKTRELEHELLYKGGGDVLKPIEEDLGEWTLANRREIERLKDNERYRREFLGNVSHEIKTPIFNIQGYVLTLLDGGLEDPNINRKYLERTEKSVERLINIVSDLEEINKLESGVLMLDEEEFDIVALAQELVDGLEITAMKRNISIEIDSGRTIEDEPAAIRVVADRRYIGQVFINLLSNAIKYGNEGGYIKISFIDLFDKIVVEIEDNGVGISQEDCARIFERFFRTDKSRSREMGGTGLGLAIVKHILEAHGESITMRSELGSGSTFSFTVKKKTRKA